VLARHSLAVIQVVSGSSPANLGATTVYTPLLGGFAGTSVLRAEDVIPRPCSVRNIFLHISTAPGLGATRTFTVLVNGAPTSVIWIIADDNTFGAFTGGDLDLAEGDIVEVKCNASGGPVDTGINRWGYELETAGDTTCLFFGSTGSGLNSYPTKFGGVLAQIAGWGRDIDGAPAQCTNVMPIAGTVTGYRGYFRRGLPAGFLSGTFTIYKSTDDGLTFIAQDGSGGTPDTRMTLVAIVNGSQQAVSFSLPVSRRDLLYMRWDVDDADGAQWGCHMGVTFTSSEPNQWPYCGQANGGFSTSGDKYGPIFQPSPFAGENNADDRASSEGGYSSFSLARGIFYAPVVPGAGNSRILTVHKAGVDQSLSMTLSDTDHIAEDLINTVAIEFGEAFGLHHTPVSGPAGSDISWGFVQDTSDVEPGGEIPGDLPILGEIGPYMVHHWPREIP